LSASTPQILELENGDMMSLRARNVKPVNNEDLNDIPDPSKEERLPDESKSGLPKKHLPPPQDNKEEEKVCSSRSASGNKNIIDRFMVGLFTTIMNMSASISSTALHHRRMVGV